MIYNNYDPLIYAWYSNQTRIPYMITNTLPGWMKYYCTWRRGRRRGKPGLDSKRAILEFYCYSPYTSCLHLE
jgi:hypothetical protein